VFFEKGQDFGCERTMPTPGAFTKGFIPVIGNILDVERSHNSSYGEAREVLGIP
jgi:hypothetical protein